MATQKTSTANHRFLIIGLLAVTLALSLLFDTAFSNFDFLFPDASSIEKQEASMERKSYSREQLDRFTLFFIKNETSSCFHASTSSSSNNILNKIPNEANEIVRFRLVRNVMVGNNNNMVKRQ